MDAKIFSQTMGEISSLWYRSKDFETVRRLLEDLMPKLSSEQQSAVLLFLGTIKKEQGLESQAIADWLLAFPLSRTGSYVRYNLQCEIGRMYESRGETDEAKSFYGAAIVTCVSGDQFSANRALAAFLRLSVDVIEPGCLDMIGKAVRKSWDVLELPGEPDVNDILQAARDLSLGLEEKISKIKQRF